MMLTRKELLAIVSAADQAGAARRGWFKEMADKMTDRELSNYLAAVFQGYITAFFWRSGSDTDRLSDLSPEGQEHLMSAAMIGLSEAILVMSEIYLDRIGERDAAERHGGSNGGA